jgi:hypothetical protein
LDQISGRPRLVAAQHRACYRAAVVELTGKLRITAHSIFPPLTLKIRFDKSAF